MPAAIGVVDDAGRRLSLEGPPRRIVSLVPSLTELLFALGAGPAVVGVTRYCTEPPAAIAALPRVGGTKNPDLARIAALAPDLVIMNAEENRAEDFAALAGTGVPVFVTEPKTVDDGVALMARLGAVTGHAASGEALAASARARVATVRAEREHARPLRYFCPIWKRPWMGFNADTYAHDVLRLCGGANVLAGQAGRYPVVTLAEVADLAPEVVLLPDEPYAFRERDVADLAPLAATPALRDGRVHLVDGKVLAWYGPRIGVGMPALSALLRDTPPR